MIYLGETGRVPDSLIEPRAETGPRAEPEEARTLAPNSEIDTAESQRTTRTQHTRMRTTAPLVTLATLALLALVLSRGALAQYAGQPGLPRENCAALQGQISSLTGQLARAHGKLAQKQKLLRVKQKAYQVRKRSLDIREKNLRDKQVRASRHD